jgi:hypothetical protein
MKQQSPIVASHNKIVAAHAIIAEAERMPVDASALGDLDHFALARG